MAHWATSPMDRNQVVLFAPTLDQSIADDHSVRLFGETLQTLDFTEWERMYVRVAGQPPIHPRSLAGCILYGLSLGIRSSRKLEDAAANRLDFIWLLEGRVPDHATLCKFRTQFGPQIKGLFRQIGRVATIAARWAACWSGRRRTSRTTGTGRRGRIRYTSAPIAAVARWPADACRANPRCGGSAGTSTNRCASRWPNE